MTRAPERGSRLTRMLDTLGFWGHRERTCRQRGHAWSDRTDPICCGRCGAMRTHGRWW